MVAFLGIDDLIRSKETEREDDWRDVALLEEIADERLRTRSLLDQPRRAVVEQATFNLSAGESEHRGQSAPGPPYARESPSAPERDGVG